MEDFDYILIITIFYLVNCLVLFSFYITMCFIHIREPLFNTNFFKVIFIQIILETLNIFFLFILALTILISKENKEWHLFFHTLINFFTFTDLIYNIIILIYLTFKRGKKTTEEDDSDRTNFRDSIAFEKHSFKIIHIISFSLGVVHSIIFFFIRDKNDYNIQSWGNWYYFFYPIKANYYNILIFLPFLILLIMSICYKFSSSEALKVTDVMKQFQTIGNRGWVSPSIASILKYRTGPCPDEVAYVTSLSRYLGIPVAIDFVPHWGNRTNGHTWNAFILPNGKSTPFYMQYAPGDTTQFTHSPVYLKPKIYRRRYEINRDIMDDFSGEKDYPELYRFPKFTDVTDEYLPTTDVTREIPKEYDNHDIAYICVNDREDWAPVHYGKIAWGKATFKSMGRNIIYSVGIWESGRIIPVGNPFIIQADGTIRDIICDKSKRQTMTLYRKYPFFAQFDSFKNRMDRGEFQGSNTKDFSKATTLFTHKGFTYGCWYEQKIETSVERYKYLRYIGP